MRLQYKWPRKQFQDYLDSFMKNRNEGKVRCTSSLITGFRIKDVLKIAVNSVFSCEISSL